MADFKAAKVVADLPATLEADTVYLVRKGAGFDLWATNGIGTIIAYPLNQAPAATKAQVLSGSASDYVTGGSYVDTIAWNTSSHSSGTVTLDLNTSLNHILNITGNVTVGAPSNATLGKTGDIVLRVNANVVVGWNTQWKFLGSIPNIGANREVWVVSYKVLSATEILASASKVV